MYEASLALAVLCFLGVCGYYWRAPAFSVFHPLTFYLAFHGILFVFRPIIAWARDYHSVYYTYQFTPSISDKVIVILASTVGMITFAFFSLRSGMIPMRFAEDEAIREERRRLSQMFVWVVVVCGPPAAYSMMKSYGAGADNNLAGIVLDRNTGVSINTANIGYITDLQLMWVSLSALIIWLGRFRLWSWMPLAAFLVLRAGTGGRGPFVAAAVSAGLFYLYEKRIRYPGLRVVLGSAAVLALFSFVGNDRGASIRQAIGFEQADAFEKSDDGERFLEGMDFANMEYFEYLVYVIPQRSRTYDYFLDNIQIATEPVPRVLWKSKPVGEPLRRIWLFDYGYPIGMTRSLPGEGWYALGWLGVLIWCGLWGHVLGKIYSRFATGNQTTLKTAAYMVFLPILVVGLRDGILLTVVRQAGVYLMPILIWFLLKKYMGIPSAADLRAFLRNAGQRTSTGPTSTPVTSQPGTHLNTRLTTLPPAVQRRRRALAQASVDQAGR